MKEISVLSLEENIDALLRYLITQLMMHKMINSRYSKEY